jgi:hypothetical protein
VEGELDRGGGTVGLKVPEGGTDVWRGGKRVVELVWLVDMRKKGKRKERVRKGDDALIHNPPGFSSP